MILPNLCGGKYFFTGCKDPTELYLLRFCWGDIGEARSSSFLKYTLIRVLTEKGSSYLRDNKPNPLESPY